jgi:hypothetical protein
VPTNPRGMGLKGNNKEKRKPCRTNGQHRGTPTRDHRRGKEHRSSSAIREADFGVQIARNDASIQMSQGKFNLLILNGVYPRHPSLDRLPARMDNALLQVLLIPSSGDRPPVGIARLYNVNAVLPRPLTRAPFLAALKTVR